MQEDNGLKARPEGRLHTFFGPNDYFYQIDSSTPPVLHRLEHVSESINGEKYLLIIHFDARYYFTFTEDDELL